MIFNLQFFLELGLFLFPVILKACEVPIIKTSVGDFCGAIERIDGLPVNAYLGVPFAETPTGKSRFLPPQEIQRNLGLHYAHNYAPACFHTMWGDHNGFWGEEAWNPQNHHVEEDCLKLNVWVPRNKPMTKLPVMVWIFGGGFASGSPSIEFYNGSALAAMEQVIVVNLNYRVGPFGFLNLGKDSEVTGNLGLLDQQMALKWVHDHIENFGGDPEQVTLFGESAGSASVTAHLFAPNSHPYFQRVAASSGTITQPWAMNQKVQEASRKLVGLLGCEEESNEVLRCLQAIDASRIQEAADGLATNIPIQFTFTPVQDDPLFFQGNVHARLRTGDFKTNFDGIFGLVKDEGTYFVPYYLMEEKYGFKFDPAFDANSENNLAKINRTQFENSVNLLAEYFGEDKLTLSELQSLYIKEYGADGELEKENSGLLRDGISRLYGDQFFNCDFTRFVDEISKLSQGNIYFYHFAERSSSNPWPLWMGVMHGYEIEFYFGMPIRNPGIYPIETRKTQQDFAKKVMKLWADFAKFGLPSTEWKSYKEGKRLLIDKRLNEGVFEMIEDPHRNTCSRIFELRNHNPDAEKEEL